MMKLILKFFVKTWSQDNLEDTLISKNKWKDRLKLSYSKS